MELFLFNLFIKFLPLWVVLALSLLWIIRKKYLTNPIVFEKTFTIKETKIYEAINKTNDSYNELSKKYLMIQATIALNRKESEDKFKNVEEKIDDLKDTLVKEINESNERQSEKTENMINNIYGRIIEIWKNKNG